MSAGATDGSYLRNAGIPTYGHSGLAGDVDDVRVHGKDERVLVKSFFDGPPHRPKRQRDPLFAKNARSNMCR